MGTLFIRFARRICRSGVLCVRTFIGGRHCHICDRRAAGIDNVPYKDRVSGLCEYHSSNTKNNGQDP